MSETVVQFPGSFKRRRTMTAAEIWAQPEPSDEMVWEMCVYTRKGDRSGECRGCPSVERDEVYGDFSRGCRGMAAEACRVVMAMQVRANPPTT